MNSILVKGSKSCKTYHVPIFDDEFEAALKSQTFGTENPGFCILCGAEADGCEPDACRYECENCGLRGVYGLEELMLRGLFRYPEVKTPAAEDSPLFELIKPKLF